jgi:hypothetical protein
MTSTLVFFNKQRYKERFHDLAGLAFGKFILLIDHVVINYANENRSGTNNNSLKDTFTSESSFYKFVLCRYKAERGS